jgi:hypothetical protein
VSAPPLPHPDRARWMYADMVEHYPLAVPVLLWCNRSGRQTAVQINGVGPETPLPLLLPGILADLTERFGRPTWLVLSFEGWKKYVMPEALDYLAPGDVAAMAEGGDPTVADAVVIYGVDRRTAWMSTQTFTRKEGGSIVWDDNADLADEDHVEGPTYDALVAAVR